MRKHLPTKDTEYGSFFPFFKEYEKLTKDSPSADLSLKRYSLSGTVS